MVLSNQVKIRDNFSQQTVESNFDPDQHHVDQWEIQRLAKVLSSM